MELVFRNIISNAIKFSKPNKIVEIFGEKFLNHYEVKVLDSGIGISEENLKKLKESKSFTPRWSKNEGGTGLGMILVKEFLEKNNRSLEVQSTLGKGSTFCIKLPAFEEVQLDFSKLKSTFFT